MEYKWFKIDHTYYSGFYYSTPVNSGDVFQYLSITDKCILGIGPNKKIYHFSHEAVSFLSDAEYVAGRMTGTIK